MTGLQNILLHIEADANAEAARIKEEAKSFAEKQIEEAVLEAEQISNEGKKVAEKTVRDLIKRAEAECDMEFSRAVLLKKQEIIKDAIEKAKLDIKNMEGDAYFEFLQGLLRKYVLNEKSTIFMSKEDIRKMPDFFKNDLKKRDITLAEEEISSMGGFILSYGKIEVNCTIDALIDDARDAISDMLRDAFFDEERGV